MCEIYADKRKWDELGKKIDGKVVIESLKSPTAVLNYSLFLFEDQSTWFGNQGSFSQPSPLDHYLVFQIADRRVIGFKFGIDFTGKTETELESIFTAALHKHAPDFDAVVLDSQDFIATILTAVKVLVQQLPQQNMLDQIDEKVKHGESFAMLAHSGVFVPAGLKAVVDASDAFRKREVLRSTAA